MYYSKTTGWFYPDRNYQNCPDDLVPITPEHYSMLLDGQANGRLIVSDDGGQPVLANPPALTVSEIEARKTAIVLQHLDAAARAYRYDDIKTACTYAEEPAVLKFQSEGQALRAWRSLVWEKYYKILNEVALGARPFPTDEELIAEMPGLKIPV